MLYRMLGGWIAQITRSIELKVHVVSHGGGQDLRVRRNFATICLSEEKRHALGSEFFPLNDPIFAVVYWHAENGHSPRFVERFLR